VKAKINAQLTSLAVPIDSLKADPKNAKIHTPKNLARIKRSLRKFGQQRPIVTVAAAKGDKAIIIAGNATWSMARKLGWEQIARVEYADEKTARAYAFMDNRSSEGGKWDQDMIDEGLAELDELGFDPADAGFEDDGVGLDDDDVNPKGVGDDLTYSVIVDLKNENEQSKLLARLEKDGYACRLLIA